MITKTSDIRTHTVEPGQSSQTTNDDYILGLFKSISPPDAEKRSNPQLNEEVISTEEFLSLATGKSRDNGNRLQKEQQRATTYTESGSVAIESILTESVGFDTGNKTFATDVEDQFSIQQEENQQTTPLLECENEIVTAVTALQPVQVDAQAPVKLHSNIEIPKEIHALNLGKDGHMNGFDKALLSEGRLSIKPADVDPELAYRIEGNAIDSGGQGQRRNLKSHDPVSPLQQERLESVSTKATMPFPSSNYSNSVTEHTSAMGPNTLPDRHTQMRSYAINSLSYISPDRSRPEPANYHIADTVLRTKEMPVSEVTTVANSQPSIPEQLQASLYQFYNEYFSTQEGMAKGKISAASMYKSVASAQDEFFQKRYSVLDINGRIIVRIRDFFLSDSASSQLLYNLQKICNEQGVLNLTVTINGITKILKGERYAD